MTSTVKVDNVQKVSDASNIIKKCGTTTTIGSGASNPIVVCGSAVTLGRCGGTVALASGATQTGFGRTGTVDWQTTIKTGDFTAVSGEGYFINTTSGAITMTLPASPSVGDIVALKDYAQTFDTNACTVGRNSQPIEGQTINLILETEGKAVTLVYGDSTKGWQAVYSNDVVNVPKYITATGGTITTSGDYKIHAFTGPGTFCVSCGGNAGGSNTVSNMLIVAGGGSGSRNDVGAGGGAGGLRCLTATPVTAQGYPIVVGAGGSATPTCAQGNNGSNSSAISLTSTGGGGAGGGAPPWQARPGNTGGSGGGGGGNSGTGGAGNTPAVPVSQGNNGGPGASSGPGGLIGGGGGGAGAVGTPGATGGAGGAGTSVAPVYGTAPQPFYAANISLRGNTACGSFAGGGGGAGDGPGGADGGPGGVGGGGKGSGPGNPGGAAGTVNSGGGGGGGENTRAEGGAGGSGMVIIKYKFQN